jgi:hypothetical protein
MDMLFFGKKTQEFAFRDSELEAVLRHLNKNPQLVVEDKRLDSEFKKNLEFSIEKDALGMSPEATGMMDPLKLRT